MREGGKILKKILDELAAKARPGVKTEDLEKLARELILKHGVEPSFLGYMDYPAVLCTSINEEAVHALPSARKLKEGDLLKLDFGVVHGGFHTDSAVTVLVGDSGQKEYALQRKLIAVTREALEKGMAQAKSGNSVSDIGAAVQKHVEKNGLAVVKELGGHGIGKKLHEEPFIPNFKDTDMDLVLRPGMVIAIEPIVSAGDWRIKDSSDGFGYLTRDGSFSAHFEHTLAITEKGPEVLTG